MFFISFELKITQYGTSSSLTIILYKWAYMGPSGEKWGNFSYNNCTARLVTILPWIVFIPDDILTYILSIYYQTNFIRKNRVVISTYFGLYCSIITLFHQAYKTIALIQNFPFNCQPVFVYNGLILYT